MNSFSLHSSSFNPPNPTIFRPHKTTTPRTLTIRNAIPARDRIIDFGKYSGKMLGTLPSNYLKWVSKNLRARDFEEWAKLADEVLDDPVYKDRLEWELAEKVLNGDVLSSKPFENGGAVSELVDISERFGWDNDDKVGWAKVDFGLLGTSKGGRIPRLSSTEGRTPNKKNAVGLDRLKPKSLENGPPMEPEDGRSLRRERLKMKRRKKDRLGVNVNREVNLGNSSEVNWAGNEEDPAGKKFPGREAFLKKVLKR
ncbi:OLC1v1019273C1 [Oldenlandia corymbosa var. corymbosa]|uniref:OLC1v1019273C1 n=1 Tax=Oldenlandia corymbosa var. corymbosa TaxID=529605 RepID=A0AAV1EDX8_OLDCO|nr:OLC1v1019273C1 [Oldenlandia corymbosa var. corymbosa]